MSQRRINELGEKPPDEQYICMICKRKATREQAKDEKWYYCVNKKEDLDTQNMQYFDYTDVSYVCNEHYKTLSMKETAKYVEIGYPYYSSILIDSLNITTF